MAWDRLDFVRHAYETWNAYGLERFAKCLADDVTIEDAPQLPDARLTRGRDAVVGRLDDVAREFGGGWVEIHDVEPVSHSVLVTMTWKVDAAGAGEETVGEVFHLVDTSAGRIDRIRVFFQRESVPE